MTNRLQKETSPYLRQHADNPVDWYPWGNEALELARREDRPILLSIGYSTCHWCHVMAHESFENQTIAKQMNRQFVNVKVDREERPDLDNIYQTCHQILHRRAGGWPLTVFLNPHTQLPFYTATYIPSRDRQGIAGLPEVLDSLSEHYEQNRGKIYSAGQQFEAIFRKLEARTPMPSRDLTLTETAVSQAIDIYDHECGGFGSPPKFPMPQMLQLLWWRGDDMGRTVVHHHLTTMIRSGCFDQLGGGFFRYATDRHWEIPHFEKMLYDNALLLSLLARLAHQEAEFARSAQAVANWLLREMHAPGGGFYGAVDADSEGCEGLFYLWTREEIAALLEEGSSHYRLLQRWFNIDANANFEGGLHLHQRTSLVLAAEALDLSEGEASAMADSAIEKLLRHRQLRIAPTTDTKVLTAWNALAIVGLLDLAEAISEPNYAEAALEALTFIRNHLWSGGCLYATWQWREEGRGVPRFEGYLDDYAMVAAAIYRSLQWRWDNELAHWLEAILEQMLSRFDDGDNGLNFTDRHSPPLILKEKHFLDSVTPSGNAVAALHLNRAGHLFANQRWLGAAERIVAAGWEDACQQPTNAYTLLRAAVELDNPPTLVILQGPNAGDWLTALNALQRDIHAFVVPANAPIPVARSDEVDTATVCRQNYCQGPAYTLEELLALAGN